MFIRTSKSLSAVIATLALGMAVNGVFAQYQPGTPTVPAPTYTWDPATPQPAPAAPTPVQQPYGQVQQPQYAPPPTYPQQPAPSYGQQPTYVPPPAQPIAPTYDPYATQNSGGQLVQVPAAPPVPQLPEAQMADLTASVALYPDPLLAQMLPAATYVDQLTYADRWLEQHPGADEATLAQLPLDPSVRDIMHYPTVLRLMTDHLDWTQAMGMAFLYQRGDLMTSIQRWRVTALQYGTLNSTPQQVVMSQGSSILILPPPQTQVIYVPVYDPAVVFVPGRRPGNGITFTGPGFSVRWLENDVDWRDHDVRVPDRRDDHRPGGAQVVVTQPPRGGGPTTVVVPAPAVGGKVGFVHEAPRTVMVYPQRIVTPQPDHKVVTVIAPPPGPGGPGNRVSGPGAPPPGLQQPPRGGGNRGPGGPPGTPF